MCRAVSAISGADGHCRNLHEAQAPSVDFRLKWGKGGVGVFTITNTRQGVTRARHANEVSEIKHGLPVAPGDDLAEGIRTRNEKQLSIGVFALHIGQSVDGEGVSPSINIHAGDLKARVGRGGDHGHEVAILRWGDVLDLLLPRLPGGDKDHLVQVKKIRHFASRH